jgi:predicted DNA-binding transcriptional regulator YafY
MADALFRQWAMLKLIPREPRALSTPEIWNRLRSSGYDITKRSVERDLDSLSGDFGYTSEIRGRTTYWFWPGHTAGFDVPGMEPASALVMCLAKTHLSRLLPSDTLALIQPYFDRAEELLSKQPSNALSAWNKKVRVISRGPNQIKPTIRNDVQHPIYEAILKGRVISAEYRKRSEKKATEYQLHPLGIVLKDGLIYLVATAWKFTDVLQFGLHRFERVTLLDDVTKKPKGFDIDKYIEEDRAFSYPVKNENMKLVALFDAAAAAHLIECPLSKNQTIVIEKDGRVRVSATTPNSADLRWWLMGYGAAVEVLSPNNLRAEMKEEITRARDRYS